MMILSPVRFLPFIALSFCLNGLAAEPVALFSKKYPASPALELREREIASKPTSNCIRIDQFGYLPTADKVAVIINPKIGVDADAGETFAPSTGKDEYQVRRWSNDQVVFRGTLAPWNKGATDDISGDQAWWFDFSAVKEPGSYYVYDSGKKVGSFQFDIRADVYADVLRAALRMYFYNRCNFEKKVEYTGKNWADGASFTGSGQDTEARSITDRDNPATAKDLSGGWWDAGDYNKYTTFALDAVHPLLDAYAENPGVFGDNNRIPESGNGVPDILDEVKWELDWLKKMQLEDGSALLKMGLLRGSDGEGSPPPSSDRRPRFYYPEPSSAATITLASLFSHAAVVLRQIPSLKTYAADLQERAVKAFAHYEANPKNDHLDSGVIQSGIADLRPEKQDQLAVQAAVYLYAASGEATYKDYVEANFHRLQQALYSWQPWEHSFTGALLYFTTLPKVKADVVREIQQSKVNAAKNSELYGWNERDPYRAFISRDTYTWGSNSPRASIGFINYDLVTYGLDPENADSYRKRAAEMLHAFHGVNVFNKVFLSNMYPYRAEKSVDELFHFWFRADSPWSNVRTSAKGGPAPGYLAGGPNKNWKPREANPTVAAILKQPPAKIYQDTNDGPSSSWEITEPGIYYQAAYIKLLSKFATKATTPLALP